MMLMKMLNIRITKMNEESIKMDMENKSEIILYQTTISSGAFFCMSLREDDVRKPSLQTN